MHFFSDNNCFRSVGSVQSLTSGIRVKITSLNLKGVFEGRN